MRIKRHGRLAAVATVATLVLAGTAAAALVGLPADGSQVNNDPANGIDPNQDAGVSDVQGGTVVAGNLQVPWATFEQKSGSSQQIFVRAFKAGAWVTQGFPASLNLDPTVVAEAPSIDFAGAGRTVPWVAWYEPNGNLGGKKQIFASRFSAASNVWLPSGQERAPGHSLPSLNINTTATRRIRPSRAEPPSPATTRFPGWPGRSSMAPARARTRSSSRARSSRRLRGRRAQQAHHWHEPQHQRLLLAAGRPRAPEPVDRRILASRRSDRERRPDA